MPDLDPRDWLLAERDRVVAERRKLESDSDEQTMSMAPPDNGASKYLFLAAEELRTLRERLAVCTKVLADRGQVEPTGYIDIVFEPEEEGGSFVETEDENRTSVNIGEWVKRDDGYTVLRLRKTDFK